MCRMHHLARLIAWAAPRTGLHRRSNMLPVLLPSRPCSHFHLAECLKEQEACRSAFCFWIKAVDAVMFCHHPSSIPWPELMPTLHVVLDSTKSIDVTHCSHSSYDVEQCVPFSTEINELRWWQQFSGYLLHAIMVISVSFFWAILS